MPDVFTTLYKPDVLSCLADLSNDEVFTPPSVVNDMLDMLPQELFESPDTTFWIPYAKAAYSCVKSQSVLSKVWKIKSPTFKNA